MTPATVSRAPAAAGTTRRAARRWWVLAVVCSAQLMITLDITIVNIALPAAQRDLGFSDAERQWVITAYALAFGSLLLISGRIADRVGRRKALVTGLVIFGAGSALGGAAPSFALLVAARIAQGVGGAMMAPGVSKSQGRVCNATGATAGAERRTGSPCPLPSGSAVGSAQAASVSSSELANATGRRNTSDVIRTPSSKGNRRGRGRDGHRIRFAIRGRQNK